MDLQTLPAERYTICCQRARSFGNYLVVVVVSDTFNAARGKYAIRQSIVERIEAVRDSGLADKIIIEHYDGKINDIDQNGIHVCIVGTDWAGPPEYVEYLRRRCEVVYLERNDRNAAGEEISSTASRGQIRIGIIGSMATVAQFEKDIEAVKGTVATAYFDSSATAVYQDVNSSMVQCVDIETLLTLVDAIAIVEAVGTLHVYEQPCPRASMSYPGHRPLILRRTLSR